MNDDLISRQVVKEQMIKYGFRALEMTVTEFVEDLPPVNLQEHSRDMEEIAEIMKCDVDAETKCKMISNILIAKPHYFEKPKTGHWIRITNGAMKEKYICSECGRQIKDDGIECLLSIKYPYCHCGAKMVEPQESEE